MNDDTKEETYDRTEPPGPKRSDKPPTRVEMRRKYLDNLQPPELNDLTRIVRGRPHHPQF